MVFSGPASCCLQCGKIAKNKCKNCQAGYYCGSKCQKKHWKSKHQQECKAGEIQDASALVRQFARGLNDDKTKFSKDFPEPQKTPFLTNRQVLRYIGRNQPQFMTILKSRCLSKEWSPLLEAMKLSSQVRRNCRRFLILTVFEKTVLTVSLMFELVTKTFHCNYSSLEGGIHMTAFSWIDFTTQLASDGKFTYTGGTLINIPEINPEYVFVNWETGLPRMGLYDDLFSKVMNGTLS
jgi:hypothetical protein